MINTREDFNSEDEYRAYTKTGEFLLHYSWKGKSKEQIIHEMALPDYEQKHFNEAIKYCSVKEEYSGIELDGYIVHLMNVNTPPVDLDED